METNTPHHPTSGVCSLNPLSINFCRNCAFEVAARCTNSKWDIDRQTLVWEQNIKPVASRKRDHSPGDVSSELSERLVDWELVEVENDYRQEGRDRNQKFTLVPEVWKIEGKKKPDPEENKEELDEWQLESSDHESAHAGSKKFGASQKDDNTEEAVMPWNFDVIKYLFR
jgi:hypothetical protein